MVGLLPSLAAVVFGTLALSQQNQEKIAGSIAKCERRAEDRNANPRRCCNRCRRPLVQCLCPVLPRERIATRHDILILQHPTEFRKKTVSTVPLLRLVLADLHVVVGTSFEPSGLPLLQACLENGDTPLLLFPGGEKVLSFDIESERNEILSLAGDCQRTTNQQRRPLLVLLDGTWSQARRMLRDSPELASVCQHVQFTSNLEPSVFGAVRRPPCRSYISTLEVCSRALQHLEGNDQSVESISLFLSRALDRLVQVQLQKVQQGRPRFPGSEKRLRHARIREITEKRWGNSS